MTRKRLGTGDIRDMERATAKRFNENGVYLPNPTADPSFDRHKPIPSDQKARAFGMEPVSPKRLFDLPRGDSGAGQSVFRRSHVFYSMGGPGRAASQNYDSALAIITNRSSTQTARYFHVSVYGFGVRRPFRGQPQLPLTVAELQDRQFEQIYLDDGPQTPLSPRFIPSVCTCQARIMVHDESGQRFYDVDVIGNRSMNVYAWGVSVFLMVKGDGYEVDEQNQDSIRPIDGPDDIGVEDDLVGARVLPVFSNITDNVQNRTITITIDPDDSPFIRRIIPIPPGSRKVQIFSNEPLPETSWEVEFWTGRATIGTRPDLGTINWIPGQSKTDLLEIPNASAIAIRAVAPAAVTGFNLVFEVEP
ncbi:MAG: hypothetical protein ACYTBS_17855 [Planctomycetota bacterium]|jgi:hypothetical protein